MVCYMAIDIRDKNTMEHLERETSRGLWEEFTGEVEFKLNLTGMSGPLGKTFCCPPQEHMSHLTSKTQQMTIYKKKIQEESSND